jgi:hypothetical protein
VESSIAYTAEYVRYLYLKNDLQITKYQLEVLKERTQDLERDEKWYGKKLVDVGVMLG